MPSGGIPQRSSGAVAGTRPPPSCSTPRSPPKGARALDNEPAGQAADRNRARQRCGTQPKQKQLLRALVAGVRP
jgi:hypothetical protein